MHLKSDNIEIMNYDKADEVIEEVFESLLNRYQIGFKISIKGSNFIFGYVNLLHYKCNIINLKRSGSYIDSTDRIKKKTISLINDHDKCFQYDVTAELNHDEIGKNSQRI